MTARTESRVVRPFANLGRVGESLDATMLLLNGEPVEGDSVTRTAEELAADTYSLSLRVDLGIVSEAVEAMGIPDVDTGLVVIATGRTLKATAVLVRENVGGGSLPRNIELDREANPEVFGDARGFSVRCAVVLLRDLDPAPLKAHRAGTWLARRDFSILAESDAIGGFNPSRLTPEIRESLGLPDGTVSFVHLKGSLLEADSLNESVDFLIDAEIHDLLYLDQNSPMGRAMQVEFALDFILATTRAMVTELEEIGLLDIEEDALDPKSPAAVFLRNAASLSGMPVKELAAELKDKPERVRSLLQASLDLKDPLAAGLKGSK